MNFFHYVIDFFNSFHVQLMIAELLLCLRIKPRIKPFGIVILVGAFCLVPFVYQQANALSNPIFFDWLNYSYFLLAILSAGVIWVCFQIPTFKEHLFYCVPAITVEHLVFAISSTLEMLCPDTSEPMRDLLQIGVFLSVYIVFYIAFVKRLHKDQDLAGMRSSYLISFSLFATFIVYGLSVWSRLSEQQIISSYLYDAICCVFILLIHFGKFERSKLERQNETMKMILKIEQDRHKASAESIALINMKYHDIKYLLSSLQHLPGDQRQKNIQELEQAIYIYDMTVKTGNDALDVLLSERSLDWVKHDIKFTCIADGVKLDFMEASDVYSLFGNALDNAIESVRSLTDKDKRVISLTVVSKGNMVVSTISNYYENDIIMENNLPVTTKPDKDFHGYGIRSIQYIAEKYGGALSIQTQNSIFKLHILLPMAN